MRQGHPGARGWDSRVSPTKEELDQMRAQDEIDNKRYWDEIESLKKIITGDGNV
jgi:hypothetical protein